MRGQQAGWEGASGLVCLLWQCCGGLCRSLVVFTGEMIWWRWHVMGGKHSCTACGPCACAMALMLMHACVGVAERVHCAWSAGLMPSIYIDVLTRLTPSVARTASLRTRNSSVCR